MGLQSSSDLVEKAFLALGAQQNAQALEFFRQMGNTGDANALYGYAVALARGSDFSGATARLKDVLTLMPDHHRAMRLLAEIERTVIDAEKRVSEYNALPIKAHAYSTSNEKLRFVQIHTFYDTYLKNFYATKPGLSEKSSQAQIQALVDDGFGANHMFAPYLRSLNYDPTLIIANCLPAQIAWCKENGVRSINENNWTLDIARQQVDALKPDILYIGDPIVLDTKFLKTLTHKPRLVVGWRAAEIPAGTDWSLYDLMLSHLQVCRKRATEIGAKSVEHFHPGIPNLIPAAVQETKSDLDVVFSGGWTPQHAQRNALLTSLAESAERREFSLGLFLLSHHFELPSSVRKFNHGARWGLEMYKTLKRGQIVVNAEIDLARGDAGNSRLFEVTGVGSMLLTEHQPNIERYFVPGVEIETFKSSQEMLDKILYYVANPGKREAIARRGHERCIRDYSMKQQCTIFDGIIRSHFLKAKQLTTVTTMNDSNQANSSSSSSAEAALSPEIGRRLQNAITKIEAGEYDIALREFTELSDVVQKTPQLRLAQALALSRIGNIQQAVVQLTKLIQEEPQLPSAHALLSQLTGVSVTSSTNSEVLALLHSGKHVEALKCAERAVTNGEAVFGVYHTLAQCLEAVGRCEEAVAALEKELRRNPTNQAARSYYETLTRALTQTTKAPLHPEQRSYKSELPKGVLDSIQKATHNYHYRGIPTLKNPFDFTLYPMLLWNYKPKTILEIGSKSGGSALWFGDLMNNFGIDGHVYSLDIVCPQSVTHPRVTFLEADGRNLAKTLTPEFLAKLPRPFLVIEDADHNYETSSAVLKFFNDVLAPGEYIVIEDGIISDLTADSNCNSGPHKALKEFFSRHPGEYDIDQNYADFFGYNHTWCTNGFLRKKKYPINSQIPKNLIREFNEDDSGGRGIESQMSTNERFQLYYLLRNLLLRKTSPLRYAEIGSYAGASLLLSYNALKRMDRDCQVFTIEPGGMPQFYEVLKQLDGHVAHLQGLSTEAAPYLRDLLAIDDIFPEVIFVDGDHTYQGVKEDILNYYPLLQPGGIIVFHDYLPALNKENSEAILFHHGGKEPGIRQACEEVLETKFGLQALDLPLLYPSDPTQTQPHLPIIPGVFSTLRAYRKPA